MVVPGRPGSPTAAQRFFANPSAMQDRTPTRSADMVDKSELSGHKKLPVGLLEIPEKYVSSPRASHVFIATATAVIIYLRKFS